MTPWNHSAVGCVFHLMENCCWPPQALWRMTQAPPVMALMFSPAATLLSESLPLTWVLEICKSNLTYKCTSKETYSCLSTQVRNLFCTVVYTWINILVYQQQNVCCVSNQASTIPAHQGQVYPGCEVLSTALPAATIIKPGQYWYVSKFWDFIVCHSLIFHST